MKAHLEELKTDILTEIELIEESLVNLSKAKENFAKTNNEIIDVPAIGTYLMNFYNGIENIIKRISKAYYHKFPKGASWHKELLLLSVEPPKGKIPLFNREIIDKLYIYCNFRHRFISSYGFQLKWDKMKPLVDNVDTLWQETHSAINEFMSNIN